MTSVEAGAYLCLGIGGLAYSGSVPPHGNKFKIPYELPS